MKACSWCAGDPSAGVSNYQSVYVVRTRPGAYDKNQIDVTIRCSRCGLNVKQSVPKPQFIIMGFEESPSASTEVKDAIDGRTALLMED